MKILYFAPGSGLGHMNRALALCLALRDLGCEAEIVTNSPFAEGLARVARYPITGIANERWSELAPRYASEHPPDLIVLDTFPFGMRGEWLRIPGDVPVVYVARRLKLEAVAQGDWSRFALTIAAEELSSAHEAALRGEVVRLPGPIRLAPGTIATPVPSGGLDRDDLWLVIHGGPEEEVSLLCNLARERMPPGASLAVVAPWPPHHDYFPAGNLVGRAEHVVSGAGYNMMADMMFLRERHTAVAFERRFDDQAGRLAAARSGEEDGTPAAAMAIGRIAYNGRHDLQSHATVDK